MSEDSPARSRARGRGSNPKARTGYVWDPLFLGHVTSRIHPERPARAGELATREMSREVPGIAPLAIDRALGLPWVRRVHEAAYIDRVQHGAGRGQRHLDSGAETLLREDTFEVALGALSATLSLVREVGEGRLENGFAAVRPPGHHAWPGHTRGFCVFNNAAAAARYAQAQLGLERVLIVDWDVHPADGTEGFFYDDPSVHVLSVHEEGLFPATVCAADHRGSGEGEGSSWNLPLDSGSGPKEYYRHFEPLLEAAASACRPELVIVSCGFDAHRADGIGHMRLDDGAFFELTKMVRRVAKRYAEGRLVSILEGGYCLDVLRRCVRHHLEALID